MGCGAAILQLLLCSWWFVFLLLLLPGATAVWLSMPAVGTKCVSEEIQPNIVVLADYAVISEDHTHGIPTISVKVLAIPHHSLIPLS